MRHIIALDSQYQTFLEIVFWLSGDFVGSKTLVTLVYFSVHLVKCCLSVDFERRFLLGIVENPSYDSDKHCVTNGNFKYFLLAPSENYMSIS